MSATFSCGSRDWRECAGAARRNAQAGNEKREIDRQMGQPSLNADSLRAVLTAKLDDWKQLLRSRPANGQRVLRTVLDGPIRIGMATADGVPWEARGDVGGLLGTLSYQVASPASLAHIGGRLRRAA